MGKRIKRTNKVLTLILFSIFFIVIVSASKQLPFETDEHDSVKWSVVFDLAVKGDFEHVAWKTYPGRDQPPFAFLFFGLSMRLHGIEDIQKHLDVTNFNSALLVEPEGRRTILTKFQLPDEEKMFVDLSNILEPIKIIRKVNVVFTLGSLFLVFLIGNQIGGWSLGALSSSLLIFHPVFLKSSIIARGDGVMLFFFILAIYLSFLMLGTYKNVRKDVLLSLFVGFSIGLSTATKLSGGLALFVVWFFFT